MNKCWKLEDKILVFSIDIVDVLSRTSYDPRVQNRLSVRWGKDTTNRSKGINISLNASIEYPKIDYPGMLQDTESITSFTRLFKPAF